MDLTAYLHKRVYVNLANGFYYSGLVTEADGEGLSLIDKTGRAVSISKSTILTITELK